MKTYEYLTNKANQEEELIDIHERARDAADFLADYLPRCILDLEGPYCITSHWIRYKTPFDELPDEVQLWVTEHDASHMMTGVAHIELEGETVFLEFGVEEESWHGVD
jgi:hypothetical protein